MILAILAFLVASAGVVLFTAGLLRLGKMEDERNEEFLRSLREDDNESGD